MTVGVVVLAVNAFRDNREVTKSPKVYAAEQRHFAADKCKARDWDECEKALNRAQNVDPDGETSDEVKGLREAIAKGRGGAERLTWGGGPRGAVLGEGWGRRPRLGSSGDLAALRAGSRLRIAMDRDVPVRSVRVFSLTSGPRSGRQALSEGGGVSFSATAPAAHPMEGQRRREGVPPE
jgi:hypothetical protein